MVVSPAMRVFSSGWATTNGKRRWQLTWWKARKGAIRIGDVVVQRYTARETPGQIKHVQYVDRAMRSGLALVDPHPSSRTISDELSLRSQSSGRTVVIAAVEGHVAGLFGLVDTLRPEAKGVVSELTRMGLEVHMKYRRGVWDVVGGPSTHSLILSGFFFVEWVSFQRVLYVCT